MVCLNILTIVSFIVVGAFYVKPQNWIPFAPNGIPLFPTQIIEAVCNLVIFFILLATYKKWIGTYKTLGLYFILYSIVRFTLEFFRGDLIRGIYFGLSTSQWISIVLFVIGVGIFIRNAKKKL